MWKNNLDEMKELELLKIEHKGMWLAFWGLLGSILMQIAFGAGFRQIMGEWAVFVALCLYTLVLCLRKGIWSRHFRPNVKTNLVASLIAAAAVGGLSAAVGARGGFAVTAELLLDIGFSAVTFVLCFAALTICGKLCVHRKEKLDGEIEKK